MKKTFKIIGLDCANCATQLENEIKKIKGVESASISFMSERMVIETNEEEKEEEVIKKLKKTIKREEPDVTIEEI